MESKKRGSNKKRDPYFEVRPLLLIALVLSAVFMISDGLKSYRGSGEGQDIESNVRALASYASKEPAQADEDMQAERTIGNDYLVVYDMEAEKQKILSGGVNSKSELYRRFAPAALIGDSFADDAIHYQFLDNTQVFAAIGARTMPDDPRIEKAIGMGKTVFIFTYGNNDMVDAMISRYTTNIRHIRETVPYARIYIQAILRPRDDVMANYPYYDLYNERLLKMCNELSVGFFDSSFIMEAHPEMYENDGIHISRKIYGAWLTFIADVAGL